MKCLFASCVNGCIGHAVQPYTSQPGFTQHVYAGTQHHGALLQHVMHRGVKSRHGDFRDAVSFRFKGMVNTRFI